MERLLMLKKELQKNFEVLKQEHEDLKNTNDEYAAEIEALSVKIEEKDNEIENMRATKSDYDTLYNKYQNLERIHSLLRENAEKFQEENQDLHEEVFKLQEQVTKLEHEIEIATKHSELSNMVPRESYEQLLKELSDLKDRRNSNQVHLDEINIDDNAKSVIENLKRDINDLRHKLSQKGSENHDNADNKIVKSERIMQLYNKYVNFELPVDYVGEIPTSDNTAFYKLECVFKTLNSFKKDIDTLEHKLSEKVLNMNHLQTQIDDLTTENDFLNTDVQHLERELDEMKKNNDFLISEIAALKNTSKLEPIIETHEDNLAKLETELADCNRINKTFESEIKRIEKELFDVRSEKIKLQESLTDLKSKYTSMLNELEMCKTQTKAVEELENSTNTEYIEKLKQASNEIDELKKRLNAANVKNEQLSIDIHIIENDKVLLTKEVDELKHALEEMSSAHKELEVLKISLEHKLQNLSSKLDEVIKHKMDVENNKSTLAENILTLENKLLSKEMDTSTNSKLEKIMIEKSELSAKLQEVNSENSALKETVDKLRHHGQALLTENNSLKNDGNSMAQNVSLLEKTIEDLKEKVGEQEHLSNQMIILNENNQKIIERNVQLEMELTTTNKKILSLEQEFEKVMTDLNVKDNIIDHLNATITQNNVNITVLNQKIVDLENSIAIKNLDMENLTRSLTEVSEKLEDYSQKINQSHEDIDRYLKEKEEINQQISTLNEIINAKDMEISTLKNHLEHLEKTRIEYKSTIDNKDKEIKELNQSIVEVTDKIKVTDNIAHQNDDYAKLIQEKETLEKEVTELRSKIVIKEQELIELGIKSDQLEKTCLEYKNVFDTTTQEKTELINLVNMKHNESLQYHNEIQRLNHVILEQSNKFQRILEEKDNLLSNNTDSCSNCEKLRMSLKEKDEIIMTLNQNTNDYDKIRAELLNANEAVRSLTKRCEDLDKSLALQLETVTKLTAENCQLSEQEQNSSRELERLRHHLVETEENYTQELMASESKLAECQTRLQQVEERAKQTSTVYTSNSIRANQEVETLRNQIRLLEKQREDVQAKLSDAEDARSRSEAALTNLQVVLEQFQLEKERDIQAATEKIRNKMEDLKRQKNGLQDEIVKLNRKLEESLAGLQAATRLGDQVETKTAQINDLKEQVRTLHTSVAAAEERYYNAISNQQDKVDKNLVKNLVINYVMTAARNSHNRTQVLRILSTVLDFNQQECERLGLVRSTNSSDNSLAVEFVKFLQNESRPRAALPNMMGLAQSSSRSTTPATPTSRSPGLGSQQNSHETGHKRNPSNGSNNLLFQNIESMETSSQASRESGEREPRVVAVTQLDTGVNQTRNTEGAILKHVLKDM